MSRSLKKGLYVDERVIKKVEGKTPKETGVIKTWSRACTITPDMIGFTFAIHNGKDFIEALISDEMVGHKLGEFSPTRKFTKHGGKMQKDLDSGK
ncbi:MAG: 30S ribosomal protein S19 [Candidatus Moraniibacteriota bacterium]|jgi:small subunit ribosomal protein S19